MTKKGPKLAVFFPGWPNFGKIKRGVNVLFLLQKKQLYIKFQKIWHITLGENALLTKGRTDKWMEGTEIMGPSGKIQGTNKSMGLLVDLIISQFQYLLPIFICLLFRFIPNLAPSNNLVNKKLLKVNPPEKKPSWKKPNKIWTKS